MKKIFDNKICEYFDITECLGKKGPYATIKIVSTHAIDSHTVVDIGDGFLKYVSRIASGRMTTKINGIYNTVIDFINVEDVDSHGVKAIDVFNELHKKYNNETPIKILNCQDQVQNRIRITGFNISELVMKYDLDGL